MHLMNIHVKHEYSSCDFGKSGLRSQNSLMNIAPLRKRRGLTQTDLADLTRLTQPTISRAERGDDSTTMATLASIAAALDVPLADLFASDRSAVEAELLNLFRRLSPDRQRGWLDMARLAQQDPSLPSRETDPLPHPTSAPRRT